VNLAISASGVAGSEEPTSGNSEPDLATDSGSSQAKVPVSGLLSQAAMENCGSAVISVTGFLRGQPINHDTLPYTSSYPVES
jgi:hypothetical protein